MTARSRERGSHAGLSGQPGGTTSSVPPVPSAPVAGGPPGGGGAPGGGSRSGRHSRHRKPAARRSLLSRRQRMALVLVVVIGVVTVGFTTGFGDGSSAEGTVQAFLLDWQQGSYQQAAALTSGAHDQVAAQLASAYTDLDASAVYLALQPISQHGDTAVATFTATVDLAEGEHQWTYTGRFGLTQRDGDWVVNWSPSVINPNLGAGDRLAVISSYAPRAQVEDAAGKPLLMASADYHIGVIPRQLTDAATTAAEFSAVTGLNGQQVLGQIRAAPPLAFLSLLTVDPASFGSLWPRLDKVPGLTYQRKSERLFATDAAQVVGGVGTEDSSALRNEGAAYEPGETVGMSGLEQAFQTALVGTPMSSVVVVNSAGHRVATLWTSPGHAGTPVRTTLNGQYQEAAAQALANQSHSGEIVAVNSANGDILALSAHQATGSGSVPLPSGGPLNSQLAPGMAFSIVSAAALIGAGVQPDTPLPCYPSEAVGGQTFTYTGQESSTTFASDFANGCGTALASMSTRLTPTQLRAAEKSFGVGSDWDLRLPSFSGTAQTASAGASLAAQAIGTSGVQVSPVGMALVAAEVDAGSGHAPALLASDPVAASQAPLSGSQLTELRGMMRDAVQSGSADGANLHGQQVYGQAGVVQSGSHSWLSWFVGYRGSVAISVLETGTTQNQAAAALAGSFLSAIG